MRASEQYPLAKLQIDCRIVQADSPLDKGRVLSYQVLIDNNRFLGIGSDSRPAQRDLPYRRTAVSYAGSHLRVVPARRDSHGKIPMLAMEAEVTSELNELVKSRPIDFILFLDLRQLGYSNRSTEKLTYARPATSAYLATIMEMISNEEIYDASISERNDYSPLQTILTLTTRSGVSLPDGHAPVHHEIVVDKASGRPVRFFTCFGKSVASLANPSLLNSRETEIKWQTINEHSVTPKEISYTERSGGNDVYKEISEVTVLKTFGVNGVPDTEFDWRELQPDVGQTVDWRGEPVGRVWNGTSIVGPSNVRPNQTTVPEPKSSTALWFYTNAVFALAVAAVILAMRVAKRSQN
jgi:hypothetical protein